ncbi:MAG: UvrB/UvrC motif-containing protein [Caldicoprobacterales bacterium]
MLCEKCNKNPATVHVTKIINNNKTELHLCEDCARERDDFNWFTSFSVNDLLTSFLGPMSPARSSDSIPVVKCDKCGMDYQKFKKLGRFGCQNCYEVFKDEIYPIIKKVQGGAFKHTGKRPHSQNIRMRTSREIEELKRQLENAIKIEAFEEAARLRDRIRELESRQQQEG